MKKSTILYCLLVFPIIIWTLSSCISSEETNYMQPIPKDYEVKPYTEYKLAIRDVVSCNILTSDKETYELFEDIVSIDANRGMKLTVYEDSTVIIPFFGNVKVAGLTLQEAEVEVGKLMKESILDAQVKLTLNSNTFYVYSNERQGAYLVYKENMTIYQALAISSQTTNRMDLARVKIVRKGDDGLDMTREFDLRSQAVIQSEFYYIQPNDVIYFSTSKNSFFNVTSVTAFVTAITTPLTLLFLISTYK